MGMSLRAADRIPAAVTELTRLEERLRAVTRESGRVTVSMSGAFANLHRNLNRLQATLTPVASVGVRLLSQVLRLVQPAAQGLANVVYTLFGGKWAGVVSGLEGTASATKSAASATKKLAAAQRTLMGFDEIERLNASSGSASSGGGSTPGGSGSAGKTIQLETVAWAERLKALLGQVWEPFEQGWKRKGRLVLQSAQGMLASLGGAIGQVGKDWLAVWQGGAGQEIVEHLLVTVAQLEQGVGGIADGFREAWVHAGSGRIIVESLLGTVTDMAQRLEEMSGATQRWAENLNLNGAMSGLAALSVQLRSLAGLLTGGLAWGYENILLPLATWTVEEAAPAALHLLTGGLEALNGALAVLGPVAAAVWEGFLQPIASWTGGAAADLITKFGDALSWCGQQLSGLAGILEQEGDVQTKLGDVGGWLVEGLKEGVLGGLTGIGTWLDTWFVQPIVNGVKQLFGIASPSTVFHTLGGFLIDGLCNGMKGKLGQAWIGLLPHWEALSGHFTDIAVGISAAIVTTWEQLQKGWSGLMGHFENKNVGIKATIVTTAESLWKKFVQGWTGKSLKMKIAWVTSGLSVLQQSVSKLLFDGRGWPRLAFAARGGVFDNPTLTMLGEAGREAVVPLENNTGWMDGLARRIAAQMVGLPMGAGGNQTITVQCLLDGRIVAENTVRYVNREARRTGVHPMLAGI